MGHRVQPEDCPYRTAGVAASDTIGRSGTTVFASSSVVAIESAVASGLAISVLDRARLTSDMRALGATDGLPSLPTCYAYLAEAPKISANDAHAARVVSDQLQGVAFNSPHLPADHIE